MNLTPSQHLGEDTTVLLVQILVLAVIEDNDIRALNHLKSAWPEVCWDWFIYDCRAELDKPQLALPAPAPAPRQEAA